MYDAIAFEDSYALKVTDTSIWNAIELMEKQIEKENLEFLRNFSFLDHCSDDAVLELISLMTVQKV